MKSEFPASGRPIPIQAFHAGGPSLHAIGALRLQRAAVPGHRQST